MTTCSTRDRFASALTRFDSSFFSLCALDEWCDEVCKFFTRSIATLVGEWRWWWWWWWDTPVLLLLLEMEDFVSAVKLCCCCCCCCFDRPGCEWLCCGTDVVDRKLTSTVVGSCKKEWFAIYKKHIRDKNHQNL